MKGLATFLLFRIVLLADAVEFPNRIIGEPVIDCSQESVRVVIETQNGPPSHIYAKGHAEDASCNFPTSNEVNLSLSDCGMTRSRQLDPQGLMYSIVVVVQMHPDFVTKVDKAFHLKCFYMEAEKVVTHSLDVSMLTTELFTRQYEMPKCTYGLHVGSPDGPVARFSRVGEKVFHVWQCISEVYAMLVHSCTVNDGQGSEIAVIDRFGCGVDDYVMQTPEYDAELNTASQETHVFKFADKINVYFNCQIKLCVKSSESCTENIPPKCGSLERGQLERLELPDEQTLPTSTSAPVNATAASTPASTPTATVQTTFNFSEEPDTSSAPESRFETLDRTSDGFASEATDPSSLPLRFENGTANELDESSASIRVATRNPANLKVYLPVATLSIQRKDLELLNRASFVTTSDPVDSYPSSPELNISTVALVQTFTYPATTLATTQAPTLATTQAPTLATTQAPSLATTQAPTLASIQPPTLAATQAPTLATTQAPVVSTVGTRLVSTTESVGNFTETASENVSTPLTPDIVTGAATLSSSGPPQTGSITSAAPSAALENFTFEAEGMKTTENQYGEKVIRIGPLEYKVPLRVTVKSLEEFSALGASTSMTDSLVVDDGEEWTELSILSTTAARLESSPKPPASTDKSIILDSSTAKPHMSFSALYTSANDLMGQSVEPRVKAAKLSRRYQRSLSEEVDNGDIELDINQEMLVLEPEDVPFSDNSLWNENEPFPGFDGLDLQFSSLDSKNQVCLSLPALLGLLFSAFFIIFLVLAFTCIICIRKRDRSAKQIQPAKPELSLARRLPLNIYGTGTKRSEHRTC